MTAMPSYRGRFAPSPTGDLHLGGASTALCAWLAARAAQGVIVLRMEDIDTPRVVAGSAERILEDLRWLGLDWDEGPGAAGESGPYVQSLRFDRYDEALRRLASERRTYRCDCSRAEIARIASAPHPGEEGPVYPGTCRALPLDERVFRRPPAIRLQAPAGLVRFDDAVQGTFEEDVSRETGDFVLRRGDGVYSYQLAVVVDDLEMGITEVGAGSGPAVIDGEADPSGAHAGAGQCRALHTPRWWYRPTARVSRSALAARRCAIIGKTGAILGGSWPRAIARALGLVDKSEVELSPQELVPRFSWERIPRGPVVIEV